MHCLSAVPCGVDAPSEISWSVCEPSCLKAKADAAPTAKSVAKSLDVLASDYQKKVNQARSYSAKIKSDDKLKWAREDQFNGKLERLLEKCSSKLSEPGFQEIGAMILEGEEMPEASLQDTFNTSEKITIINNLLDSVLMHQNKIKPTAEKFDEDQPSQD